MNNPLKDVAPSKWRRVGYVTLLIVGLSLSGLTVGFAAIDQAVPKWLIFTSAFYGTVTGPFWSVPASNVPRSA